MYNFALGSLVGEYDNSGNIVQEIVWLGDIPVASIRTNENGSGVGVFYIHTDHLNAPTKLTRATDNQIVWRWDHDPFGNGTPNEDPDGNGLTVQFNLRYPGQYQDQETGLYYNYYRYYDPQTGRYITSDPMGLKAGTNTYAYVAGNPISFFDPKGLILNPFILELFPEQWSQDRCKQIQQKIDNLNSDIEKRYEEIAQNQQNPSPLPQYGPGPNRTTVQGHYREINRLDQNRRKLQDDYDRHCRCKNDPPGPPAVPTGNGVAPGVVIGGAGVLTIILGTLVLL